MFNSTNPQDFYKNFACDDDCRQYLFDLKWNSGYVCRKCGNNRSWKGRTNFHRRCTACGYDESCTAYTLFHKPKLPLLKAFGIVFQIISSKKGKSTVDLAREFGVNQPTAWLLKNKVQKAASIGISEQLNGPFIGSKFSLDSIIITHRGENLNGFQRVSIYLAQCGESETQKYFITKS
ncbi:MAG: IS1595 family transposase [Chitinophagaceae bacterium]|nr:MAG: IS1595 family transposase [Chitinophagaceae bacterium]